jgi:hypothetical protein
MCSARSNEHATRARARAPIVAAPLALQGLVSEPNPAAAGAEPAGADWPRETRAIRLRRVAASGRFDDRPGAAA